MADTPLQESGTQKMIKYTTTKKGMILIAEIVLSFVIIICFSVSVYGTYIIVAVYEVVSTTIIFIVFSLQLETTFRFINFPWTDFFRATTSCLIFFIISLMCMAGKWTDNPQIFGGVFCLLVSLICGYDAYLILTEIRMSKERPQVLVASV